MPRVRDAARYERFDRGIKALAIAREAHDIHALILGRAQTGLAAF
jgi:hypothetical protein